MSVATAKNQWIQLRLGDSNLAGITVQPEDGDLFSLTKQMIDRSGQMAYRIDAFEGQLEALKRELESWLAGRSDSVGEAFLVLKADHFLFLVVTKGRAHDGDLEDALTNLDMKVARDPDYDLIKLSVLALPAFAEEAIESFLPHRVSSKGERGDAEREEPPGAGQP